MEVFDSSQFRLNKNLLGVFGLWPYDSHHRKIIRISWFVLILIFTVPQVAASIIAYPNIDKVMEIVFNLIITAQVLVKYVTLAAAENKMRAVYDIIAKNWLAIVDGDEKRILLEYSNRGRLLTLIYSGMMFGTALVFFIAPLVPEILNALDPLPVPRTHLFIFNGEFFVENRDDHFFKIYLWDVASALCVVALYVGIDSMYTVTVEQGTALYAIITYRLSKLGGRLSSDLQHKTDSSYEWLVHTIKLHQTVISFTEKISDSYSTCFFCLSLMNIIILPLTCVVTMMHLDDIIIMIRYALSLICLLVHVFTLFWPGQKLIDHSTILLDDAYCNYWYETPAKTKKLLRIFMLRCSKPCVMTAGGLVVMNFQVYLQIVKTAASYVTVLASYR